MPMGCGYVTKLVGDTSGGGMAFSSDIGSDLSIGQADEPQAMDLGIAAQGLQDPMDGLGAAPMGDLPMAEMGDMPMAGMGDMPMAGMGDMPMAGMGDMPMAGLGSGDGELPALLGSGPMGEFDSEDALAEISELAGLPNSA